MSYQQQYQPTNNGYLPKSSYGARLGLEYEESKNNRHLPRSPYAVNVESRGTTSQYQLVGYDSMGRHTYQLVYRK